MVPKLRLHSLNVTSFCFFWFGDVLWAYYLWMCMHVCVWVAHILTDLWRKIMQQEGFLPQAVFPISSYFRKYGGYIKKVIISELAGHSWNSDVIIKYILLVLNSWKFQLLELKDSFSKKLTSLDPNIKIKNLYCKLP